MPNETLVVSAKYSVPPSAYIEALQKGYSQGLRDGRANSIIDRARKRVRSLPQILAY